MKMIGFGMVESVDVEDVPDEVVDELEDEEEFPDED